MEGLLDQRTRYERAVRNARPIMRCDTYSISGCIGETPASSPPSDVYSSDFGNTGPSFDSSPGMSPWYRRMRRSECDPESFLLI